MRILLLLLLVTIFALPTISKTKFGNAQNTFLFTMQNDFGMRVNITNYGGIIQAIWVPDRDGKFGDVVLGFDNLDEYIALGNNYFGALVGRFANRIARGKFALNATQYQLGINNPPNHLHGGFVGFDKQTWQVVDTRVSAENVSLVLQYTSMDGDQQYPSSVQVNVTYTLLNNGNAFWIHYRATNTGNKSTIINLTNHSYFNLAAGKSTNALQHDLQITSQEYTPVDDTLIPTGEIKRTEGTPFDFYEWNSIGSRIAQVTGGYDHNLVLRQQPFYLPNVQVQDPVTGRAMKIYTSQPGLQFYSGNFLDGSIVGKYGIRYVKHYGICLETQHFPDSPNHSNFPNTMLAPGETLQEQTAYSFELS